MDLGFEAIIHLSMKTVVIFNSRRVKEVSESTNFKWYVMRAISGKENKVKEYIETEIKNSDLGQFVAQVLIPTEKVYQIRNGKKITKERSYMPGYVLIEANLVGEIPHRLRNTPNVIGFLEEKTIFPFRFAKQR